MGQMMNGSAYRLLGYAVWHGGKWYVRRRYLDRLPSARVAAVTGLVALATGAAVVTFARRALN
jgi:hypothetical protein